MNEKLKKALADQLQPGQKVGLFLSFFRADRSLAGSEGILFPNNTWESIIDSLSEKYAGQNSAIIAATIDIVTQIQEEGDPVHIQQLDVKKSGIAFVDAQGTVQSVILPDVQGVVDSKHALFLMKQKYNLGGKIAVYSFSTRRITLSL